MPYEEFIECLKKCTEANIKCRSACRTLLQDDVTKREEEKQRDYARLSPPNSTQSRPASR